MLLPELAYACTLYARDTDFDAAYVRLLEDTAGTIDPCVPEHRTALLVWLNRWGCRQFRPIHYAMASEQIEQWYAANRRRLPELSRNLWEMSEAEIDALGIAYDLLRARKASYRIRSGRQIAVSVGLTGASKILFALRPRAALPWDVPMRKAIADSGHLSVYAEHLRFAKRIINDWADQCSQRGLELEQLPALIGRPLSSLPKLLDEYLWITVTRGRLPTDEAALRDWDERLRRKGG